MTHSQTNPTPLTRWRLLLVACILGIAAAFAMRSSRYWPIAATVSQRVLRVGDENRTYRLLTPDSIHAKDQVPVVFAFHDVFETSYQMAEKSDLDRLAAEHGFLLVYLEGRNQVWHSMIPENDPHSIEPDLEYFEAAVDEIVRHHRGDPKRIYVVGAAQGGAMTSLIAAKRSELIAGAVCCNGWVPAPLHIPPLKTSHKCPMLFIESSGDGKISPDAVRMAKSSFSRDGHPTELRTYHFHGRSWPYSRKLNDEVWAFLADKHL